MELIQGKRSHNVDRGWLAARAATSDVLLDLGTGDGRFVRQMAIAHPHRLCIGVDACRENLWAESRTAPPNAIFVIANALALPPELHGVAAQITINFPWGSLLRGLLDGTLLGELQRVAQPHAALDLRLNAGALIEAGVAFEAGATTIRHALLGHGWRCGPWRAMDAPALRSFPTTWARRLAWGRDPRALALRAEARG
jgi:16S rRNA (adenine(1408)-N(1))-methyltransferase